MKDNSAPTASDFAAIAARALDVPDGCGDHSCAVRRPQGMATNGGCRCERPALRRAAAAAKALRTDVHLLLGAIGHGHLLDPAGLPCRVARARPGVEVRLASRWIPRHVWTLHRVPGRLEQVLAVCRRVLSDDDIALVIETPGGDMHVELDELAQMGRARGWGDHRYDEHVVPAVSNMWGCDLCLDVFDHVPTLEERAAWLARRVVEQVLVVTPPTWVWVTFPDGDALRVERCRAHRHLGHTVSDVRRCDLRVELPGYEETPPGVPATIEHVAEVDFYELATEGFAHVTEHRHASDGARRVYLEKPTKAKLAAEVRSGQVDHAC